MELTIKSACLLALAAGAGFAITPVIIDRFARFSLSHVADTEAPLARFHKLCISDLAPLPEPVTQVYLGIQWCRFCSHAKECKVHPVPTTFVGDFPNNEFEESSEHVSPLVISESEWTCQVIRKIAVVAEDCVGYSDFVQISCRPQTGTHGSLVFDIDVSRDMQKGRFLRISDNLELAIDTDGLLACSPN